MRTLTKLAAVSLRSMTHEVLKRSSATQQPSEACP